MTARAPVAIEDLEAEIRTMLAAGQRDIVAAVRLHHPEITPGTFHIAAERALRSLGVSEANLRDMRRSYLRRRAS